MNKPLALSLPLQGRQWIEASAGTGKTFTLSLLVLRLLLEREIPLPNILAVTFTKAATEELKIRIRAQIKLARDLLEDVLPDDLQTLAVRKQATAFFLGEMLLQKTQMHLRQMLDLAIQDCDRASIFTIHGFCSRVLSDHALSAGQVLQSFDLLASTRTLNSKIAFDLWREFSADDDLVRSLVRLWPNPGSLAKQCDVLLQAENLLPEVDAQMPEDFDIQALNEALRSAVENHLADAKALLREASGAGILNLTSYKPASIENAFESLEHWYRLGGNFLPDHVGFERLSGERVKTTKKFNDREPRSALFDAIAVWQQGYLRAKKIEQARDVRCLHLVRQRLMERRETVLQQWQQYTYDDLINQVAVALDGESGPALCQALRKDYPVALVDEFQDTDSQQWKIFSRLYPEDLPGHALYLIGDPKQAIYRFRGGDVHAYLAAKRESKRQWNLPENFRSRASLLGAVETLFIQGGDNAFLEPGIEFHPVHAGGTVQETDCLFDDSTLPAMQLALLPEYIDPVKQASAVPPVARSRELATHACVEKIHGFLTAGSSGKLKLDENGELRNLQARDIAVLVNTNAEAITVQSALSSCGIASVISSQEKLFATTEAQEVFIILDALVHYRNQARWRGALSTVLLGYHAEEIHALEFDDAAATRSADLLVQYREIWLKQGVLSLLSQLCADAAARLLQWTDGERRLGNYLQLAETLQQASALAMGPEQCLQWLARAMQDDSPDEENMLRLDSDQKRVKIMTLHKSKGLEFPLVLMPFASFGKGARPGGGLQLLDYHEHHKRLTYALVGEGEKNIVGSIKAVAAREQLAEQVRLLYVGLTRAKYYCWVCCGAVKLANSSGLSSLLFANDKGEIKTPAHDLFLERIDTISRSNPDIAIELLPDQKRLLPKLGSGENSVAPDISQTSQHLELDWRVLSFSQLTHATRYQSPSVDAAADEAAPASELMAAETEIFDRRFSGVAFGNALHHVLEKTDVDQWAALENAGGFPASELPLMQQALLRQGYTEDELLPGIEQLSPLVFNTLRTVLPEGVRLCDLPANARLNEMEFHFSLRECESAKLLDLLKRHGILLQREDFAFLRRLNGLMTGKVDLIYLHQGRFYICDYKSNRLPDYATATCLQAMRDSEYDFQALIYTLALHRWCKFRLNKNYDYQQHIGGIRYLFCRGMDADSNSGEGVVALRFEPALIEALESLLHPLLEAAA